MCHKAVGRTTTLAWIAFPDLFFWMNSQAWPGVVVLIAGEVELAAAAPALTQTSRRRDVQTCRFPVIHAFFTWSKTLSAFSAKTAFRASFGSWKFQSQAATPRTNV